MWWVVIALLWLLQVDVVPPECAAPVQIVQNGIAAFESGVPQIGPYTDVEEYAAAGQLYIFLRCGRVIEVR